MFYTYRSHSIISGDRSAALECKWHRFDFEYRLPPELPTSFKEREGKLVYFATAVVVQPHGADIETHEFHFHVDGQLDVEALPARLRSPVERKVELYRSDLPASFSPLCGAVPASSSAATTAAGAVHSLPVHAVAAAAAAASSDNDSCSVFLEEPASTAADDDESLICAVLCLSGRAFAGGDVLIANASASNQTSVAIFCSIKVQQVQGVTTASDLISELIRRLGQRTNG